MKTWIPQKSENIHNTFLCGDFNCTFSPIDRQNNKNDPTSQILKTLINTLNMDDIYRLKNPTTRSYTYFNKNYTSQSRIDYIFTPKYHVGNISKVDFKYVPRVPDHKAVIIYVKLNEDRGPGFWKLNIKWLDDDTYCKSIKELLNDTNNEYKTLNPNLLWDMCKIRIKEFSIKYAIAISRQNKNELKKIESDIKYYETKNNNDEHKNILLKLHNDLKIEVEKRNNEEIEGARIRSRLQWITESENNPNFYKSIENKHQTNNKISALEDKNGSLKAGTESILEISHDFYKNLFTSKNIPNEHIHKYLKNINLQHILTSSEADPLEQEINENECTKAIKQIKKNRSPGHDGLPIEFYEKFWPLIKTLLLNSFQFSYNNGELAYSHQKSIVTLIFKKGDRTKLKNYRPISLSNVDYKILAFILANRLHLVLDKLISPEQTAYVKDRFIGENIRQIEDLIDYTNKYNIPGIILFLDFEKAFDSIEWNFIHNTLVKFGFKNNFCHWIKTIYNKSLSSIKINGYLTPFMKISRGIRQGCPLSALIFILCTEILARAIKTNKDISGISLKLNNNTKNYKLSQYADDMNLYIKTIEEALTALDLVLEFGKFSGLKLNISKTEGMLLGSLQGTNIKIANIKFLNSIRYLGIYVGNDHTENNYKNWESRLEKFQRTLDNWKSKNLSIYSKVNFIKTYAISQLNFVVLMLEIPDGFIEKVERIIYNFLWGKREKVRRLTIICNKSDGGLEMLDIHSFFLALKAPWIHRLLKNDSPWTYLPQYYINQICPLNILLKMSFQTIFDLPCMSKIPKFYQQLILAYTKSKIDIKTNDMTKTEFYDQILWGNRIFKIRKCCLYSKSMINSGIITIRDVLDINGSYRNDIYNRLLNKNSFFSDVYKIKECIRKYKYLYTSEGDINLTDKIPSIIHKKSKPYYIVLKQQKEIIRDFQSLWANDIEHFDFNIFYVNKLRNMNIIKVREFLFKIVHRICPCNSLLYRWKISNSTRCIYCNYATHDYKHMLWECREVQNFWTLLIDNIHINITYHKLILGIGNKAIDNAFSVLMFIIYKKFIIDNNGDRSEKNLVEFIKTELDYRINLYKYSPYCDYNIWLTNILNAIE